MNKIFFFIYIFFAGCQYNPALPGASVSNLTPLLPPVTNYKIGELKPPATESMPISKYLVIPGAPNVALTQVLQFGGTDLPDSSNLAMKTSNTYFSAPSLPDNVNVANNFPSYWEGKFNTGDIY